MSYGLETLNRGTIESGFLGTTECVRLGALPSMPVEQFAQYSTDTILEIFKDESIDPQLKQKLMFNIAFNCGRVVQAELQQFNLEHGFKKGDDEFAALKEAGMQLGQLLGQEYANPPRNYPRNPFIFSAEKVTVSNFYELDIPDFVLFATYVLGGGHIGWNPDFAKIPQAVSENVRRLMRELKR